MRLWIYRMCTFIIQILGRINVKLIPYNVRVTRGDRLCYCKYEDAGDGLGRLSHISCCDCGASHYFWKAWDGIYGVPVRPVNYDYKPRLKVDTAFADEEAKRRWDFRRS